MLKQEAGIDGLSMQTDHDRLRQGVWQCDLMADVVATKIRGTPEFGGD